MTRFWVLTAALILAMLLLFFLGQSLQWPILAEDTSFWLAQEKWVAGLAGVGLLVLDVVAPTPSSIVMLVNGVIFGAIGGTVLSVIGGCGAAWVGYWLGGRAEAAGRRWLGEAALTRANAFFQRHGMVAVIVSRPVPILAEAVTIIAGVARMPQRRFAVGVLGGLIPTALIFALAGAYAINFNGGNYVLLAVLALAGVVWVIGRKMTPANGRGKPCPPPAE